MSGFEELYGDLPANADESQETEPTEQTENVENDSLKEDDSIEASAEKAETETEVEVENTEAEVDTESELATLKVELEKAEARMKDKDKFINDLMNQNKKSDKQEEDQEVEQSTDFWDDPENYVKNTEQQIAGLQAQIAEQAFASANPDYYKIVNVDSVNAAMSVDPDFADEFANSGNQFETAYTYLKQQNEVANSYESELRAKIEEEVKAKYNVKQKKDIPKSVNNVGSVSGSTASSAPSDGFSDVYGGQGY